MLHLLSPRNTLFVIWSGATVLITIALYMQYAMGLIPCALCMTQRVFIIAIGVTALITWLLPLKNLGLKISSLMGMLLAIIGGGFSSRHIWLQNLPEDLVPTCGPGLAYLLENTPFVEALRVLLQGDGNCAEVSWSLLGLTIPSWTLIAFVGLFLCNAWVFYTCRHWQTKRLDKI